MKKRIFTEYEKNKMIELYTSGKSTNYIKKELNIVPSVSIPFLRKNNVQIRSTVNSENRKYTVNHDYFEKIDTKDKAYFLGFMFADGNNFLKGIRLEIHSKDVEILNLFKKYIKYSGKIHNTKRLRNKKLYYSSKITINSFKLAQDSINLGFVPNKTFKTVFPSINKELYPHFIRGYFDGDGSICKNNVKTGTWNSNFSGYKDIILSIKKILIKECNLNNSKLQFKGDKGICTYNIGGNIQNFRLKEYLYKDCDDLFLSRKKEKFDKVSYKIVSKICSICGNKSQAKGLCSKHYHQERYNKNKIKYV